MQLGSVPGFGLVGVNFLSALILAAPASPAQGNAQAHAFSLRAQVNDHLQLSRSEINPEALTNMAPATVPAPAISLAGTPQAAAFASVVPVKLAASARVEQDLPNSCLLEKNVDWSRWISQVADRWYYVLRLYEDGANAEFITQRPAQIQFTCYNNGQIANVALRQSSGNLIYDHLQMVALMQALPVPPFPAGTKRTSITLLQGWESHIKRPGEHTYIPGSFGKDFPTEKVREWVTKN